MGKSNMTDEELQRFILDPSTGLTSANKIYHRLNKQVPISRIQDVMSQIETYQTNQRSPSITTRSKLPSPVMSYKQT